MSVTIKSLAYLHSNRETLFEDLHFTVPGNSKAALVGNNGAGKSTLLKIIAGLLRPAAGEAILSGRAYYVPQHTGQYDEVSVAEALLIENKRKALHAILKGDVSHRHFADLDDDWDIEEKARAALSSWQLDHLDPEQKMASLSGGEKTKVLLAGIQLHAPGVILLDEPSNHMDAGSRDRLYDWLSKSKVTIIAASHDKALLDLLDITLELSGAGVELFGGNYTFYRQQKEEKLKALQSQLHEQTKMLKQARQKSKEIAEQRQKKEMRNKASGQNLSIPRIAAGNLQRKAEQSTSRMRQVHREKVENISDTLRQTHSQIQQYQALRINLGSSGLHRGKILIDVKDIRFSYGRKELWPSLSFQVRSGDRLQIEGPNGSGKTTLLKLLTGNLRPAAGEIVRTDGLSCLHLDQDYTLIERQLTVWEQVQRFNSGHLAEHELKSLLHASQFPSGIWDRKCGDLSGGEKMKLALCCLGVRDRAPGILILDEPTNNLDMQSLDMLTLAVKEFSGALLVISHDRHFIEGIGIGASIDLSGPMDRRFQYRRRTIHCDL